MQVLSYLSVPLIIFLAVVAPLWIIFHYITKWKRMQAADLGEGKVAVSRTELEALRERARQLQDRMASLERILEADSPDWRAK